MFKIIAIALSAGLALAAPASAQEAASAVAKRSTIFSADGTKIGRVDSLVEGAGGSTAAVRIIYRGKFITVPASTLSPSDKGFKTSLSNADIKKM